MALAEDELAKAVAEELAVDHQKYKERIMKQLEEMKTKAPRRRPRE